MSELLNSSSWKDRSKGCQVIPKLKCGTNRDMTQKLSYLMWHDWNKDVRMAAAQALGKTGNGKVGKSFSPWGARLGTGWPLQN